jgi:hypothetical protein
MCLRLGGKSRCQQLMTRPSPVLSTQTSNTMRAISRSKVPSGPSRMSPHSKGLLPSNKQVGIDEHQVLLLRSVSCLVRSALGALQNIVL